LLQPRRRSPGGAGGVTIIITGFAATMLSYIAGVTIIGIGGTVDGTGAKPWASPNPAFCRVLLMQYLDLLLAPTTGAERKGK